MAINLGEGPLPAKDHLDIGCIVLDRFEIKEVLGQGGFGITYKAEVLDNSKTVAIKEFFPDFCAFRDAGGGISPKDGCDEVFAKYRADFRAEAEALSRFDHPNIVGVLERFDANNSSYLVMDFVEGELLERVCQATGPLPTEAVMLLAENLIEAVTEVHDQGYVHRDIKPGNIILARLEEARPTRLPSIPRDIALRFGRPVLLDFGSAREADASGKTMTGILTPSFGAPEQSRDRGRQDGRTDLYGLAATLYYALAAERIPAANDREGQDLLIPAAQRFAKHAPPSFLRAIDRALQLRPEYRPENVRAFRGELFGDFQIEGWSRPASEFDPPGPGIYTGRQGFIQAGDQAGDRGPSGVAFSPRYFAVAGLIVALVIIVTLAARGVWQQATARPSGTSQTPVSAKTPTPFAVAKSIDIAMRQMQASQSVFNEISTLRVSRNEFARTPGLEDSVQAADRRIAELEQSAKSDKQDAFEMFQALVESAIQDPTGFSSAIEALENKARADGRADDLRKLQQIHQFVLEHVKTGFVTKQGVDDIWNRQVEVLR